MSQDRTMCTAVHELAAWVRSEVAGPSMKESVADAKIPTAIQTLAAIARQQKHLMEERGTSQDSKEKESKICPMLQMLTNTGNGK